MISLYVVVMAKLMSAHYPANVFAAMLCIEIAVDIVYM